jgi:7,8-dihydropterin-6-yl-methyl-4-(beta-D-ribofuranosyl)aminobenzene 5'-phosphate synthase
MKVTALIENKASGNLNMEHGLAVHIEYNGKQYLLDTGASDKFVGNAKMLGVDLSQIDTGILSHAHYDHSGGYPGFFSKNSRAKVYLQSAAKELCYCRIFFIKKYIGIPKGILDAYKDRFVFVDGDYQLDKGVWLISHNSNGLEARGKKYHMYQMKQEGLIADGFSHEQSLVFETDKGLVILNSCSHAGVDIVAEEVKKKFPDKELLAVIGGFHLMGTLGTSFKLKKLVILQHWQDGYRI